MRLLLSVAVAVALVAASAAYGTRTAARIWLADLTTVAGCQGVQVSAVGTTGVRAVLKVPGNAKDCPPPIAAP
jgi:hypothetical protein